MVDIISRILRLTDGLTNSSNFKFTLKNNDYKLYLYDFRIPKSDYYFYNSAPIVDGFLSGNLMYEYTDYLKSILKDRPDKIKLTDAKLAMNYLINGTHKTKSFLDALFMAYYDIFKFTKMNPNILQPFDDRFSLNFNDCGSYFLGDFNRYVIHVRKNFEDFQSSLNNKIEKLFI